MHQLIASPFLDHFLLVRPGRTNGMKIGRARYQELRTGTDTVPPWLTDAARRAWGIEDLTDVLVREPTRLGYARASWEINKGCDYACDHCYLGLKKFEGLTWEGKAELLHVMRDAGVLWLQITGGEPLIDRHFPDAYALAAELGMMLSVSSNGSQLAKPRIQEVFAAHRPYQIMLSVYGATAETYEGLTHSKGAFGRFIKGLDAAREADLPVKLNIIVAEINAHEVGAMETLAEGYGFPHQVYTNMSPTIEGGGERLVTQAAEYIVKRKPFTGCNAGHTFFHCDPWGKASICKVGRDPQFDLIAEGLAGLEKLGGVADSLQLRTGGCSGCTLSGTCWTCRPLAKLYQEAKAPLVNYCQHGGR